MICNWRFHSVYAFVGYVVFQPNFNVDGAAISVAVAKGDFLWPCCRGGYTENHSKNSNRIVTHLNWFFLLMGFVSVQLVASGLT